MGPNNNIEREAAPMNPEALRLDLGHPDMAYAVRVLTAVSHAPTAAGALPPHRLRRT
jgi:hypothetical protein